MELPDGSNVLDIIRTLARSPSVGVLVDQAMSVLERSLKGSLVSFNRMDLSDGTATVALRPYGIEHEAAVKGVVDLLDEHPVFRWYTTQSDWSPVRVSDLVPWEEWRISRVFVEVLSPIGACHSILVMLTPPATGRWVYLAVNRADRDFSDDEYDLACRLQPGLVALYARLSSDDDRTSDQVRLTKRERTVLGHLAGGLTADAIARQMSTSPATIRKHLQNIYAKFGTSDRLGAVIRGRDLGLLKADELSLAF